MCTENVVDTFQVGNLSVEIHIDMGETESPREWSPLGTFWTFDTRYFSPDKVDSRDPWQALVGLFTDLYYWEFACHVFRAKGESYEESEYMSGHDSAFRFSENPERVFEHLGRKLIMLPVFKYEHGGVAYNTSGFHCPWDSGQVGWIFVRKDKVRQEYGCKVVSPRIRKKVLEVLRAEVCEYSKWANGEVYGFVVRKEDGEELDSCWGHIGLDFATESGRESAEYYVKRLRKNRQNRLKTMIKNRVPLDLR